MKSILVVVLYLTLSINLFSIDEPMHVVLLNPAEEDYWFWQMITDFMQAAANDLGIELEVLYSNRDHMLTIEQAEEVVNRPDPPDYIITGNEKGSAGGVIEAAHNSGVSVFVFNNGFVNQDDINKYGEPRGYYPSWIGQYIPNNYSAGYQMGKQLIEMGLASDLLAEDMFNIVAIAGRNNTHASTERVRGLEAIVAEYSDQVTLIQVVPGDWTEETARLKSQALYRRYDNIDAVWGANDVTAFGAMTSAIEANRIVGTDIIFGGCGWSIEAINMVADGTLTTTVGGHFMEGAWALIMLYDYHNGIDFINEELKPEMFSIDSSNVDQYLAIFGSQDWEQIDFRSFSKVHNPYISAYNFSIPAVMAQF